MNYHSIMKEYKQVDAISKVENADSHEFIQIIYNELITNLKSLSYALKEGPKVSNIKSKSFSQSLTSIMILSQSLDFENGEPIASNLFKIYDYCRTTIIKEYRNCNYEGINSCIDILEEINSAWSEIKQRV